MKKLLSLGLLALLTCFSVSHATLAYKNGGSQSGNGQLITAYITATAADATATITGKPISNLDGRVKAVYIQLNETTVTGTSPTVDVQLLGSTDGTNWSIVKSADATPVSVATGAVTSASSTVVALSSCQELRCDGGFPPYLAGRVVQAGTSPTLVGTVDMFVERK